MAVADPKTWQPVVGPDQSSSLAASLIGYLATQCHLFSDLAHLLLGGCHPAAAAEQSAAQISLPEALASNLTVRFLSLSGHPEVAAAKATLPRLMCVPLLWSRCPRVLLSVSTLLCAMPKPIRLLTPAIEPPLLCQTLQQNLSAHKLTELLYVCAIYCTCCFLAASSQNAATPVNPHLTLYVYAAVQCNVFHATTAVWMCQCILLFTSCTSTNALQST